VATAGLGLLAAQQAGAFESQEQALQDAIDDAVARAMAPIEVAQRPDVQRAVVSKAKRKVSKYSKAVKAGMKAVKASKFGGKPGKLTNAKTAFATVNKVASAVNKGKKVAKTGIRGVAARAIRRIL
jgi:flavin-binding protein dodecin